MNGRIGGHTCGLSHGPVASRHLLHVVGEDLDNNGVLWFAEYRGGAFASFDTKTKEMKEYKVTAPWGSPYDVVATKTGEVWMGNMANDMVTRYDTKTGGEVDYLLPRETNIRRVYVDDRGARPVMWVGSNHGGEVLKVEPLD